MNTKKGSYVIRCHTRPPRNYFGWVGFKAGSYMAVGTDRFGAGFTKSVMSLQDAKLWTKSTPTGLARYIFLDDGLEDYANYFEIVPVAVVAIERNPNE